MAESSSLSQWSSSNDINSSNQSFFLPYTLSEPPVRPQRPSRKTPEKIRKLLESNPIAAQRHLERRRMKDQMDKPIRNTPIVMRTRGKRRRVEDSPSKEYQAYNNHVFGSPGSSDGDSSLTPYTSPGSLRLQWEATPGHFIDVATTWPSIASTASFYKPEHTQGPQKMEKMADKGPSPIERLPYDLLNEIFFLSRNIFFPRSSPIIGIKLSAPSTYNRFCREYLCFTTLGPDPRPYNPDQGSEHLDQVMSNDQTIPTDLSMSTDQSESTDQPTRKPIILHSMGPAICWHDDPSSNEMALMIDVALSCRWATYDYINSIRSQLNDPNRPALGRMPILKPVPGCMSTPFDDTAQFVHPLSLDKLDICFRRQIVPRKLLRLPVQPGQMEFLKLMFELGASVNNTNSCDTELAQDLLRNSVLMRDYKSLWVLLKPGTRIYPDRRFRRWALEITRCEREMVAFFKQLRNTYCGVTAADWPSCWPRRSYDWSARWPECDPIVCTWLCERYGPNYLYLLEKELKGVIGEMFSFNDNHGHSHQTICSNVLTRSASNEKKIDESNLLVHDFTDDEFDSADFMSDSD